MLSLSRTMAFLPQPSARCPLSMVMQMRVSAAQGGASQGVGGSPWAVDPALPHYLPALGFLHPQLCSSVRWSHGSGNLIHAFFSLLLQGSC